MRGILSAGATRLSQGLILAISILLEGLPRQGLAGINRWTSVGPFGGTVRVLAIDQANPLLLLAGTAAGVLRSEDGGGTWLWTELAGSEVHSLEVDPRTQGTVYAATRNGVFKSTDSGVRWNPRNSGLSNCCAWDVAVDPSNSSVVYVGTYSGGVFKSTDGAESWHETGIRYYSDIRALAIDPIRTSTVYACGPGTISKSTDGGATWTVIFQLPRYFADFALDPERPDTLYATTDMTVFTTRDGGITWSAFPDLPGNLWIRGIAVASGPPQLLLVATDSGVYRCDASNGGCSHVLTTPSWEIAASGARPGEIFVGTIHEGVLHSRDSGSTWTSLSNTLSALSITALAHGFGGLTLAATEQGLYRKDAGEDWELSDRGLERVSAIDGLMVHPSQRDTAYAGGVFRCPSAFPCLSEGRIFKTTDGGRNWHETTGSRRAFAFAVDTWNPGMLYAGTDYYVLKSTDYGESWNAVGYFPATVYAVAVSPPFTVYAGTSHGVYRSTDGASTWRPIGPATSRILALAISPANRLEVYAGAREGVFKTTDGGETWHLLPGLPLPVTSLQINLAKPSLIYAATSRDGVFRTTDAGKTWTAFNDGYPVGLFGRAVLDDSGTRLYIGTYGGGVFEYQVVSKFFPLPLSNR